MSVAPPPDAAPIPTPSTRPGVPSSGSDAGDSSRSSRPGRSSRSGPSGLGDPCLAALGPAIDAARSLGLDVAAAEQVRRAAETRLGLAGDAYVLALVGGTGVGKSSLLNALAGAPISPASVRRPTTAEPIAWLPAGTHQALGPVLDWLGVRDAVEHDDPSLGAVAILDLPDVDSIEPAHRAQVEALLPRVDAVAWVSDPEKYHDALLHDEFFATWFPRLERQLIVINKADRLRPGDAELIEQDLRRDLARMVGDRARRPRIIAVSALGDGGISVGQVARRAGGGIGPVDGRRGVGFAGTVAGGSLGPLRAWIADGADVKRVVRARVGAAVADAIEHLSSLAGTDPRIGPTRFVDPDARRRTTVEVTRRALDVIDLDTLERQAIAATRARARARGAGPLGPVTALIYRLSGRRAATADPEGFLMRWRSRGSLAPAVGVLRDTLSGAIRAAPPALRPALSSAIDARTSEPRLASAIDRAIAGRGRPRDVPAPRAWMLISLLATLATVGTAASAAWIVLWILLGFHPNDAILPILGRIPIPLVALAVSLAAGWVAARLLRWHAGRVGRRWAAEIAASVHAAVDREVTEATIAPLDRLEAGRRALWLAARTAEVECRRPSH